MTLPVVQNVGEGGAMLESTPDVGGAEPLDRPRPADCSAEKGTIVPLSDQEQAELQTHEATIQRGLEGFAQAGLALAAIRERRLYRAEFRTFEEYCRVKWRMTARRARQIWAAAAVVQGLNGNNCSVLPATESQARPLTALPPEQRAAVWAQAVETAPGGRVTAAHVQSVVDARRGATSPQASPPKAERVTDAGTREERLRETVEAAIAKTRELLDTIGTADSVAAAEVATALQGLEQFRDHLQQLEARYQA
ncbi:MAG: hypothetical protein AB1705_13030 [Verrucomicrobiota bacterium]